MEIGSSEPDTAAEKTKPINEVSATDTEGVRSLMRSFGARKEKKIGS
jgi:hypothetical protein